jgi:nucleoside-diphosphate-sugar epimerase
MKQILIFGAGWLGMQIAESLCRSGRKVIVATRDASFRKSLPNLTFLEVSFSTADGAIKFNGRHPENIDEILVMLPPSNMLNYEHTIASICSIFPAVGHFVFTSSTGVYVHNQGVVNESFPIKENHPVVRAEKCIKKHFPRRHSIIRLSGLVGCDRHPVSYLLRKERHLNGLAPVNLIHRLDILVALQVLLDSSSEDYGVYNLCYPKHLNRKEYYCEMARALFKKSLYFETQGNGKTIDGSKFANTFNYSYQYDIGDATNFSKLGTINM